MKHIKPSQIQNSQLVDIRDQKDFQAGHLPGSINLTPKNFKKYAKEILNPSKRVIFIAKEEKELEEIPPLTRELGFTQADEFLLVQELAVNQLEQLATLPAKEFLRLPPEEKFILLDVRTPSEITRPAPEANLVNLPIGTLVNQTDKFQKDHMIYTLCGSGNRSTTAASIMKKEGFDVQVIEKGIKGFYQ